MATIQIDAAASSPLREGARPRPKRKSRSCVQWWSILPHTYKFFLILVVLAVLLVGFLFIQSFVKGLGTNKSNITGNRYLPNPVYEYTLPKSYSTLHLFKSGAVCSDAKICSEIGKKVMEDGGNVADSAIATLFCNGIATLQSQGIGGGFVMNLFIGGKAYTLNARDVAPINLKNDTFKTPLDYLQGPLAIATPGEVKGYWELHRRFGFMKWKDLIQPSIELCERGIAMTEHFYDSVLMRGNFTAADPYLRKMLYNSTTNEIYKVGTTIHPAQQLCDTYKIIAENGGEDFYSGHLADLIAEDLQDLGSVITKQDLQEYKTVWSESVPIKLDNRTMYIPPAPTGGAIVALILNILKGYKFTPESIATEEEKILTYHRILESFKFGFGQRSRIGDPDFIRSVPELLKNLTSADYAEALRQKIDDTKTFSDAQHYGADYATSEDHGTSHVSILAPNGDAISVTSSVNTYFGCGLSGRRTGIIFSAGINDFSVPTFRNQYGIPASPANYLTPKKRSLTSMSPIILTDENNKVQLLVGAAGGTKIITSVALTIMRTLWFEQNIKEAIDAYRIHHHLEPMIAQYEYGMAQSILDGLQKRGHVMQRINERGSIVCALYKNETGVYGNADFRKKGDVVGLN